MRLRQVRIFSMIAVSAIAAILAIACGQATSPPASPPASPPPASVAPTSPARPSVAGGKALYDTRCAACHGQLGEGGKAPDGTIATPLSAHMRAHEGLEHDSEHLVPAVLDGLHEDADGSARTLAPAMPRFRGALSEDEVKDIIAYMETLP
jgi:mono/diheme cytochrome c family protein